MPSPPVQEYAESDPITVTVTPVELTEEEQAERKALREEYLADWRRGTLDVLENTYVIDEKGNKRKLQKKQ